MRDTLEDVARWQAAGKGVAQATVVSLIGSAPRGVGATLVVSESGEIAGSVSNGCVEPDIVERAQRIIHSGKPRLMKYGVTEEQNYEHIGLSCGGEIRVFIERLNQGASLAALESASSDGLPAVRALVIAAPTERADLVGQSLTVVAGVEEATGDLADSGARGAVEGRARALLGAATPTTEQVTLADGAEVEVFYQTLTPPRTLLIVGAGHISLPLTRLAKVLGFHITVVDPRESFATRERLPEVDDLIVEWPDEVMDSLPINASTAVCILTHDEKFDVPSLVVALRKKAGYIGMVGSKGTRATRDTALREQGFTDADLARIHGPIGLDIGARTPEEIAVATLAQIVAASHGKA
ncbi:MAG TPA: XdhC/CoxI family protein [Ktedonobacterales bacterium]